MKRCLEGRDLKSVGEGLPGKVFIAVAVEQLQPKGFGRYRIQAIPNVEADTRRSFLLAHIEPGTTILYRLLEQSVAMHPITVN